MSHSKKNKNFTSRLDPEVADGIRSRAPDLGMSQSYYITCLYKLDMKYNLLKEFPDPLAEAEADADAEDTAEEAEAALELNANEASAMIERLKNAGYINGDVLSAKGTVGGATQVDTDTSLAAPQRPQMRSREDLLRIARDGGPNVQDALRGGVGNVGLEIRRRQLQEIQEERREREMRKRLLEEDDDAD